MQRTHVSYMTVLSMRFQASIEAEVAVYMLVHRLYAETR